MRIGVAQEVPQATPPKLPGADRNKSVQPAVNDRFIDTDLGTDVAEIVRRAFHLDHRTTPSEHGRY